MRWRSKPHTVENLDKRTRCVFCWLPRRLTCGNWVWLEWVMIDERYVDMSWDIGEHTLNGWITEEVRELSP